VFLGQLAETVIAPEPASLKGQVEAALGDLIDLPLNLHRLPDHGLLRNPRGNDVSA
jgi:hypothetical protein